MESRPQAQYLVYTEDQLRDRKQRALSEVTSVLSIPDADAVRVLRLFKWCAVSLVRDGSQWLVKCRAIIAELALLLPVKLRLIPHCDGHAVG